jgi:hypothetical protein
MIQDNGLENNQTDVTVVFEGPFSDYTAQTSNLTTLSLDRTRRSYIINSVPGDTTSKQLADDVDTASQTAQYLFFTYLAADYYSSFDSHWTDFIASITST